MQPVSQLVSATNLNIVKEKSERLKNHQLNKPPNEVWQEKHHGNHGRTTQKRRTTTSCLSVSEFVAFLCFLNLKTTAVVSRTYALWPLFIPSNLVGGWTNSFEKYPYIYIYITYINITHETNISLQIGWINHWIYLISIPLVIPTAHSSIFRHLSHAKSPQVSWNLHLCHTAPKPNPRVCTRCCWKIHKLGWLLWISIQKSHNHS